MFRKHFNHLCDDYFKKEDVPFYSWECITIQTIERDIYLIIKNEKIMEMFIKYLVYHLETVDGNRGSSHKFENSLANQVARNNRNKKSPNEQAKHIVMTITAQKYRIIKIRQKISFIAFVKKQTVAELIVR